jgi:hypothetical protein
MVRFMSKNTKRKALYPVKQIGETTKRGKRNYPDPTILLKLRSIHNAQHASKRDTITT